MRLCIIHFFRPGSICGILMQTGTLDDPHNFREQKLRRTRRRHHIGQAHTILNLEYDEIDDSLSPYHTRSFSMSSFGVTILEDEDFAISSPSSWSEIISDYVEYELLNRIVFSRSCRNCSYVHTNGKFLSSKESSDNGWPNVSSLSWLSASPTPTRLMLQD